MMYLDNALTVTEQIALLKSKGLVAGDDQLSFCLNNVSYHRLSGYWHPFRFSDSNSDEWKFRPGTDFNIIWDRYVFDRQLRLLVLDAVERIEVAIRNDLILHLAVSQGPFGYLEENNLPNMLCVNKTGDIVYSHKIFLNRVRSLFKRELKNGNPLIINFRNAHGECKEYLPYWILTEILEFGTLRLLMMGAANDIKKQIASRYGLKSPDVLDSWLGTLRSARNNWAHHGRCWNQQVPVKPILPNAKNPDWHTPVEVEVVKDRAFGTLTILKYLMDIIAPQSSWADKLENLFVEHPNINRKLLGYPDNWNACPIWSSQSNKTLLTVKDVMKILGVTQPRVSHLLRDGKLSAIKIGRRSLITKQSLDEYLKTPRTAGRPKTKAISYHFVADGS